MTKYKTPKIEDLFDAGVHIGHQARRWHPKMEKYIFSAENKIHLFDLEQTKDLLEKAAEILFEIAKKGGQIIFVGTKRQASGIVKEAAVRSGALFVAERWLGGTITNYKTIKKNMDKLINNLKMREEGGFQKYTKKERLLIDREIEKLEKFVGGIVNLKGAPMALVVIDPRKEKTSIREAMRSKIPTVGLVDSNTDPTNVTHPIPGNDDAIKSISLIVNTLADAVEAGYVAFARMGEDAKEALEKKVMEAQAEALAAAVVVPVIINTDAKEEVMTDKELKKEEKVTLEPIADVVTPEKEKKTAPKKPTKKA